MKKLLLLITTAIISFNSNAENKVNPIHKEVEKEEYQISENIKVSKRNKIDFTKVVFFGLPIHEIDFLCGRISENMVSEKNTVKNSCKLELHQYPTTVEVNEEKEIPTIILRTSEVKNICYQMNEYFQSLSTNENNIDRLKNRKKLINGCSDELFSLDTHIIKK